MQSSLRERIESICVNQFIVRVHLFMLVTNNVSQRDDEGVNAKLLRKISVVDSISNENFMSTSKTDVKDLFENITPIIVVYVSPITVRLGIT